MRRWWWLVTVLAWGCVTSDGGGGADGDATTDNGGTGPDGGGGDDDDDLTGQVMECDDTFTPCGGDPVGTWDVMGFCSVPIEGVPCEDLVVTILEDRSTGTVDVRSDNTYTRTNNIDLDAEISFEKTCIAPIPCALVPPASGGIISSCVDDGTSCVCQGTVVQSDTASGGWVMDGDDFVADGEHWPICVGGNQAVVEEPDVGRTMWQR